MEQKCSCGTILLHIEFVDGHVEENVFTWQAILFHMRKLLVVWSDSLCFDAKSMLSQFTKFCVEQNSTHKSGFYVFKCVWYAAPAKKSWHWWLSLPPTHSDMSPFLGLPPVGVFDMPNSNRYNILSISIFCKTHSDMSPFLGLSLVGVFDMPHSNWYNILSISIFRQITQTCRPF